MIIANVMPVLKPIIGLSCLCYFIFKLRKELFRSHRQQSVSRPISPPTMISTDIKDEEDEAERSN